MSQRARNTTQHYTVRVVTIQQRLYYLGSRVTTPNILGSAAYGGRKLGKSSHAEDELDKLLELVASIGQIGA